MAEKEALRERVRELLQKEGAPRSLIPLLQLIQERFGYLPPEGLEEVSRYLKVPLSRIYGVVTFYAQFSLVPKGKHLIQICQGTACHVQGGKVVLEALERELGLRPGETSDRGVSLEVVRCVGCCSLAPVMVVDGMAHGRLTPEHAVEIVRKLYDTDNP